MAPLGITLRMSLSAKLIMLSLAVAAVFAVVIAIMISTFGSIKRLTGTIITRDVRLVVQNSAITRDISAILSETNLLLGTFYGQEQTLQQATEKINAVTSRLLAKDMEDHQRKELKAFHIALTDLLGHCALINDLYSKTRQTDKDLHELLSGLEGNITGKIVEQVLAGDDTMAYEQIAALIPSYRESLLHIALQFNELYPAVTQKEDFEKIQSALDNLHLRLRTLLASDPEVSAFGELLLTEITNYQALAADFKQENEIFRKQLATLKSTEDLTLAASKVIDDQSANAAQSIHEKIATIMSRSARSVLLIATLIAIVLAIFIYLFLERHIRRPIQSILHGIEPIRSGNLQTRIRLGRHDEWHAIETALNQMIGDLENSYDSLQKKNTELSTASHEMAENMRILQSEIEQRRQAEQEAEKLQEQLQHAQKMEAIGTLAGGIAHDFNNLLQGIQGYSELLLLKTGGQGRKELQEIQHAARRGGELTRQLLTFSRKVKSDLQPIDLDQVIIRMRDLLERTIPKMIRVELHLHGKKHFINADASQIEQVLMNLAVNARDAMPEGGTLSICTEEVELREQYKNILPEVSPGPYILLSVSDTGEGMDEQTRSRIFDPFFTTKDIGKGTGLGLAIVYGIVKSHRGHILCYSEPGKGTTFKIYLPAIAVVKEHLERDEELALPGGKETILLVDDDASIRDIGQQILSEFGYTVLCSVDGESALATYEQKRELVDLVILDLIMPGMGGEKCLEKLLIMNPQLKVIIASGYSAAGPLGEMRERGVRDFINKPYDIGQLLRAVREVLNRRG